MIEINQQNAGADPDLAYKLKVAQDEVKAKNKALEVAEKSRKELVKKVEEEVSARAKDEADATQLRKVVDILQKIPSSETVKDKSKIKCRDVSKPGGCRRAGSCDFLHPALANKNTDRDFWVAGKCSYPEKDCRYKHDPKKKGTDKTKERGASQTEILLIHPAGRKRWLSSRIQGPSQPHRTRILCSALSELSPRA